ncbi:MAG: segregation/condensation protein A [Micavibrio aeruginosavorus]|uniref:Segregation and condensation protein A n=1 Tax=Micavibrio aeruginosavorus TaxID=349221 RepID=A0A2W5HNX4_9BACT|nr:MAG: segregation/condensation protein A [Micavibrio aeruginosavorus]
MTEEVFVEDERKIASEAEQPDDALVLHLNSYEGPIDVLLQLARDQKVDLTQISILQLARQYLAFIDRAQELSLDVAAEYLVMAAWLAYLKSRLLLPREKEEDDEPSAEMMAEALAFQLQRLEAIQAGAQKMARQMREYLTVYGRGHKEAFKAPEPDKYTVDLYQLLKAYGDITQRKTSTQYKPVSYPVMTMEEALSRMTVMLGRLPKQGTTSVWTTLNSFMPENIKEVLLHKSSMASLFTASLELAKQGKLEIRQEENFKPIYLRVVEREPYVPEETPQAEVQSA